MMCNYLFDYFTLILVCYQLRLSQSAPNDIEEALCPGTKPYVRDNTAIFSSLGQRCTTENDAYLLGAMYYKYALDRKDFGKGSLQERWTNIAYLDASIYDSLGSPSPTPPKVPSCIFNERLTKHQSPSGLDVKVALSCNPFDLTFCRTEYDDSLSLKDYCDCNYLYSVKEKTATGNLKCFAKAGVPCKFQQNPLLTDPFLQLPNSIDCHSSLTCKPHKLEQRTKIFDKAFHGFGMNPIAYEYMKENAIGY